MAIRRFFGCLSLLFLFQIGVAQDVIAEYFLCVSTPSHSSFKKIFSVGACPSVSMGTQIGEKAVVVANGGANWYFKKIDSQNSIYEDLLTWRAGIQGRYKVLELKNVSFWPFLGTDFNSSISYYSIKGSDNNEKSDVFFSGKGISIPSGVLVKVDRTYIKVGHVFYSPVMKVASSIVKEAADEGIFVQRKTRCRLGYFEFGLGYIHVF